MRMKLELNINDLPEHIKAENLSVLSEYIQDLPVLQSEFLDIIYHSGNNEEVDIIISVGIYSNYDYVVSVPGGGTMRLVLNHHPDAKSKRAPGWYDIYGHDKMDERMVKLITELIIITVEHIRSKKQYPFVQVPKRDWRKVKNPAKKAKLQNMASTIVYLDQQRAGELMGSNGNTSIEFGFPRRMHRRTLTSSRYKNHPKYLIEKGVFVRQAWVGPMELSCKDRTYKLHSTITS